MASNFDLTSDQVKKIVEIAMKRNPVYTDMLGFHGRLFVAQQESISRVRIEPPQIPDDVLAVKMQAEFPLIEIKDFTYDPVESANLLVTLAKLARDANSKLAASTAVLLDAVVTTLDPEKLFNALLNADEAFFDKVSGELEIEKHILGFMAYNSLKPSLSAGAAQLSALLPADKPWLRGYCPICGSAPLLSILDGQGARSLICSFCWHAWVAKRIYCPFCENSDNQELHYFFSEDEKELRVYLCERCNKYLKTVDAREMDRMVYPPLEEILTLHLDFRAQEEGYEPGIRLFSGYELKA